MAADPDISGLQKILTAFGTRVLFAEGDSVSFGSPTYTCAPADPLLPDIFCPGPISDDAFEVEGFGSGWGTSFTIPSHWQFGASSVYSDSPGFEPDLTLLQIEVDLALSPYTSGCRIDSPIPCDSSRYGCALPAAADDPTATADLAEFDAAIGGGTPDWQPAGITPWNLDTWDPARDPAYFDGFNRLCEIGPNWTQGGIALLTPPSSFYSDPDPLDPGLPYTPFLWRWRDVVGQTFRVRVPGLWHSFGVTWSITAVPYRYITPPVTSPDGTVYWL